MTEKLAPWSKEEFEAKLREKVRVITFTILSMC